MDKQIDRLIEHIRELEARLGEVDNNLRYIKVVQALKHSLEKLNDMLKDNTTLQKGISSNISKLLLYRLWILLL